MKRTSGKTLSTIAGIVIALKYRQYYIWLVVPLKYQNAERLLQLSHTAQQGYLLNI